MTVVPAYHNLTIYQGNTFYQLMQLANPDGTLVDLTDKGLQFQARQQYYSANTFVNLTTENGGIIILLTPKGDWDAATNSPTLADGVGTEGDIYTTTVAGTQDLGSGAQIFAIGDYVKYSNGIWMRVAKLTILYNVALSMSYTDTSLIQVQNGIYNLDLIDPFQSPPTNDRIMQGNMCISFGV